MYILVFTSVTLEIREPQVRGNFKSPYNKQNVL